VAAGCGPVEGVLRVSVAGEHTPVVARDRTVLRARLFPATARGAV
jgi:hypothetical protein